MPDPYATFADFTAVNSIKGVTESEINSHWLFQGASHVDEALGDLFTVPFSSNNRTAQQLNIDFARLSILETGTINQGDSEELRNSLDRRITMIRENGFMMTADSGPIYATGVQHDIFSTNQDFKPTFDMRDPERQRVDPDLLDEMENRDRP